MMALVVAVTVVGLRAVGLILVVALLVIPAAAARFWTERLWVMTLLAGVLGAVSGYLGAAASALLPRFPAGAVIVLVAGAFFLVSLLLAPARGVVAAGLRHARLRLRVASQHLLRAVYEAEECGRSGSASRSRWRSCARCDRSRARGWGWSSAGWRFAGSCAGSTAAAACCSPTPGGARPCG
jgi:manganese/zinc/iron transport system permease protein